MRAAIDTAADTSVFALAYDRNSNLTSLTPPSKPLGSGNAAQWP
jgi:hypothetical protein